MRVTH